MKITITAIRYQFSSDLSFDERTALAENLVDSIAPGTELLLKAEPDNVADPKAIAVYLNYVQRIGYVSSEELDQIHPLLDKWGEASAKCCGKDGHVTLVAEIDADTPDTSAMLSHQRKIAPSPLDASVRLPFLDDERALELIAHRLLDMEITKANAAHLLNMATLTTPLLFHTISNDDISCLRKTYNKLQLMSEATELWSDEEQKTVNQLTNTLHDLVGNMHDGGIRKQIYDAHYAKVEKLALTTLNPKYDNFYLNGNMAGADEGALRAEYNRLHEWLMQVPQAALRCDKEQYAHNLYYLRLTRTELYDILGVLITVDRLSEQLGIVDSRKSSAELNEQAVVDELAKCFYGDTTQARAFLLYIKKCKPTEITSHVNELVNQKIISHQSKKRALFSILQKYGLYTCSETNWNKQVY